MDHFLAARPAKLNRQPSSSEARKLTAALVALTLEIEGREGTRERARTSGSMIKLRSTVGALIHDLLEGSHNHGALGFIFRPDGSIDRDPSCATLRQQRWVREAWKAAGLIDHARLRGDWIELNGEKFNTRGRRSSKGAGRMRATPKLIELAEDYGITPGNIATHFTAVFAGDTAKGDGQPFHH